MNSIQVWNIAENRVLSVCKQPSDCTNYAACTDLNGKRIVNGDGKRENGKRANTREQNVCEMREHSYF